MKYRIMEGNLTHSSLERLNNLPEPKQMTVEQWFDDYFRLGIYFDTRYDRRILWTMRQIQSLYDSGNRNFLINPLIYGDVESCLNFAEQNNSIKI